MHKSTPDLCVIVSNDRVCAAPCFREEDDAVMAWSAGRGKAASRLTTAVAPSAELARTASAKITEIGRESSMNPARPSYWSARALATDPGMRSSPVGPPDSLEAALAYSPRI